MTTTELISMEEFQARQAEEQQAAQRPFMLKFGEWEMVADEETARTYYGPRTVCQLILCNGKQAGKIRMYLRADGEIHIDSVEVDEAYRGKGFATQWLEALKIAAKSEGYNHFTLVAVRDGRFAWRKLGFEAEAMEEYSRAQALRTAKSIMEAAKWGDIAPLGSTDWRRWLDWQRRANGRESLTMFDIQDFRLKDGRSMIDMLLAANKKNIFTPSSSRTMLSWNGLLRF